VPAIVVNGRSDGPTLLLSAAIHGPELTGTEVIRQVCREVINPEQLRGAIIALPIANPYAYRAVSWFNPEDGYNLNRVFPGSAGGWLTSRLAYAIMENAVKQSNAIIDFHTSCGPQLVWSILEYDEEKLDLYRRSKELADAFGLGIVEQETKNMPHRAGAITEAAAELNIPAMTVELEIWRRIIPSSVEVGVRGALNVMRKLDMIDGKIEPQTGNPKVFKGVYKWTEIFSNEGGLVEFVKNPGDNVKEGELITRIRNPFGDVLDEVKSPVSGIIFDYPIFNNQAVRSGELMVFIGSPKK
jgi:hypothetical protein